MLYLHRTGVPHCIIATFATCVLHQSVFLTLATLKHTDIATYAISASHCTALHNSVFLTLATPQWTTHTKTHWHCYMCCINVAAPQCTAHTSRHWHCTFFYNWKSPVIPQHHGAASPWSLAKFLTKSTRWLLSGRSIKHKVSSMLIRYKMHWP